MAKHNKPVDPAYVVVDKRGVEDPPVQLPPVSEVTPEAYVSPDPYARGLGPFADMGWLRPVCGGVLVYAVMPGDKSTLAVVEGDTRRAICFEIHAVAPDVPAELGLHPGMHSYHVSASVEPLDRGNSSCRWFIVHWMDLRAVWWPDGAERRDDAPVVEPKVRQVTGQYPVRSIPLADGTWGVVDNAGEVVAQGMSPATAKLRADDMNRAHALRQPLAVTIPSSQTPGTFRGLGGASEALRHVSLAALFAGLSARACSIVERALDAAGPDVAMDLATELRAEADNTQAVAVLEEPDPQSVREVPRTPQPQYPPSPGGEVGVITQGGQLAGTFPDPQSALDWAEEHLSPSGVQWTFAKSANGPQPRRKPPKFEPPPPGQTTTFWGPAGMAGRGAPANGAGPVGPGTPQPQQTRRGFIRRP